MDNTPAFGQLWTFNNTDPDDPFPPVRFPPVKVMEIKNGWVRYTMSFDRDTDNRMPIERFQRLYTKLTP